MARKYQREAAARARAGRAAARATAASNSPPVFDNLAGWDSETPGADHTAPIFVDSGSESDCGYTGGVNCYWEDSDYEPDCPGTDSSQGQSDCDTESLSEFEGDDLEINLEELRAELDLLEAPSKYAQITGWKSVKEWKKVEKNRALGYTGTSQRTQQRKAKEARERATFRKEAQIS